MKTEKLAEISNEVLYEISKHLHYELLQFHYTAKYLSENPEPSIAKNAHLESFLLHARSLIDFLYCDSKNKKDDCLASDFINIGEWKIKRPTSNLLNKTKIDCNKFLAHLTFTRLEGIKEWQFIAIREEIYTIFRIFFKGISDHLICEDLKRFKKDYLKLA